MTPAQKVDGQRMVWCVYSPKGILIGEVMHAEDAAALVALHGNGASVQSRYGRVLWIEGREAQPASESYDFVAQLCVLREAAPTSVY